MNKIYYEELQERIHQHQLWLNDKEGKKLVLVNYDLSGSDLNGSNLSRSDLSWSDLNSSDLSRSNLSGSDLMGSNLGGSDLSCSNLSGSNFSNSDLRWSDLSGSNLRWSNLRGSNLRDSNLCNSDLSYSNLGGSDLENTHVSRLYGHPWEITVYPESLAIGCERHTIEEWEGFTNKEIDTMNTEALDWWKIFKNIIISHADAVQTN